MKYDTILDATRAWVNEMSHIPSGIIEKLLKYDSEEVCEITPPSSRDRVYVYDKECYGEIVEKTEDVDKYLILLDNGSTVEFEKDDFEVCYDGYLPMWGTLWAFGDSCDNYWLEELGGLQLMADCGFRIYEQEDYGYIFGIDGAGYSFFDEHWVPLYKARGLKWHKEAENGEA